ncbi:hypothetical protein QE390_003556 [Siphonobacter sp. SORGH_AS 1065]|nr:hypothetical protein [Siphonobacter sp. SORGH_AS_1065]
MLTGGVVGLIVMAVWLGIEVGTTLANPFLFTEEDSKAWIKGGKFFTLSGCLLSIRNRLMCVWYLHRSFETLIANGN